MTILYPTPAPVKPARPFGRGILRSTPVDRAPFTAADEDWYRDQLAARAAEDRHFDQMAYEAACLDRYTRGHVL